MKRLKADYTFSHFAQLTPKWLEEKQVKFIISSLNGTLVSKGQEDYSIFDQWYESIEEVGTGLIIVSNGSQKEVDQFIKTHKLIGYGKCKMPNSLKLEQSLFEKGLSPDTVLLLGNCSWSDIMCGKRLGIRTAKVKRLRSAK